jgi:hypothetical protein
MFKKRLVVATVLAADIAAIPVVDDAINTEYLVLEVRLYMHVLGVEKERVNTIKDFDHSLLKCRSLLKPNLNMISVVGITIGSYVALLLPNSF